MSTRTTSAGRLFAPLVDLLCRLPAVPALLEHTVGSLIDYVRRQRFAASHARFEEEWRNRLFGDGVVRHGPFAGMRYPPKVIGHGSRLLPKLLGSYERELHSCIEELCQAGPDLVVDIGCAEGYYAIGFAMRCPRARIEAHDLSATALDLCRTLAEENNVADRVTTGGRVTAEHLRSLPQGKVLVISDCEGAEKHLFDRQTAAALQHAHVLIELHDALDPAISLSILPAFEATHDLRVISSIPDLHKPRDASFLELEGLDWHARFGILDETRPGVMEWALLTPRSQ